MKFDELYETSPSVVTIEHGIVSWSNMVDTLSKYPKGTEFIIKGSVDIKKEDHAEIGFQFKKTGYFDCSSGSLTTLEGSPEETTDNYDCSDNDIITLKGAPEAIGRDFICNDNSRLHSLKGGPSSVNGNYIARNCTIDSFEGIPEKFTRGNSTVNLAGNYIKTFDYCPAHIDGDINLADNDITSLVGIHRSLLSCRKINLSRNPITEGGIGLLFIKGLENVTYFANENDACKDALEIIAKYLESGDPKKSVLLCQEELIDAGLEAFAEL